MDWVKIKSWHIIRTYTRVMNNSITLCGRTAVGAGIDTLPQNEKSCESCLRIYSKVTTIG